VSFKTRMEDPVRHANYRFRSRVRAWPVIALARGMADRQTDKRSILQYGTLAAGHECG